MARTNEDGGASCLIERLEPYSKCGTRTNLPEALTPVDIFLDRSHVLECLALTTKPSI